MTSLGFTLGLFDEKLPRVTLVCELCRKAQDVTEFVKLHGRKLSKRCATCRGQSVSLRWHHDNPQRAYVAHRNWMLRTLYDMSHDDYLALLEAQGGGCAVCGTNDPGRGNGGQRRHFTVDHDHNSGRVRGLLCNACNRAIGYVGDSPDLLRRAAAYLETRRSSYD